MLPGLHSLRPTNTWMLKAPPVAGMKVHCCRPEMSSWDGKTNTSFVIVDIYLLPEFSGLP